MNVLIVTAWYPTETNPISGIFVKEIARALSRYSNVLILHMIEGSPKGLYEILEFAEDSFKVVRVRYKRIRGLSFFLYLYLTVNVTKKIVDEFNPDVVHLHVYKAGLPALILKKLFGVPYVITEHYKLIDGGSSLTRRIMNKIKILMASTLINYSELMILPSRAILRSIESHGILKETRIIPNVVNTEIFSRNKPIKNNVRKLLFVGGLEDIKGVEYLLRALGIVVKIRNDFILDIVGDGPERKKYEKMVKDLKLERHVFFHGLKPKEEVAEFMKCCSFFVLPSLWESQACVLIEAMACGKPVIATSSGGPKEIVMDFCGVLVPPGNVKALAEAIVFMLDHFDDFPSDKISKYARSRFSHEKVGKLLYNTYKQIVSNKLGR